MKPILMSSENPDGLKLEEVLSQLQEEIRWKINKIINEKEPQAIACVGNNNRIIEHLAAAEGLQRTTMYLFDAIGPNEGPLGKPRIGGNK